MIDFKTIAVGDKVVVVGAGAPGFANLGDELEITKVQSDRVYAKRHDRKDAFFALTCGAARLELVTPPCHGGSVVGPCFCGGWPGGKCFKCAVAPSSFRQKES